MIDLVPDIKRYPHIFIAHQKSKLIIFIGAGVSSLWGCKSWREMAIELIEDCFKYNKINYWQKKVLIEKYNNSPRRLITIAKAKLGENRYLQCLKEKIKFSEQRKKNYPNLFKNLFALNAIIITTNIDNLFTALFDSSNIHFRLDEFNSAFLKPRNLFHLHGIIDEPSSLVMTIDEYVKRYQNPQIKSFLQEVFINNDYLLLFIGYSMGEMEIIDYMIEKYSKEMQYKIYNYYILLPFFQNEENLLECEIDYFHQINVNVIPYGIDEKGYEQLYDVIAKWKEELLSETRDKFYEFTQLIEKYK